MYVKYSRVYNREEVLHSSSFGVTCYIVEDTLHS